MQLPLPILVALLPAVLALPAFPDVLGGALLPQRTEPAPILTPLNAEIVPDKYLVKFKDNIATAIVNEALRVLQTEADYIFNNSIKGFAGRLTDVELKTLQNLPLVDYIEKDMVVKTNRVIVTQENAPWGIARISHKQNGHTDFKYMDDGGENTCSYVLDTGIDASHPDFEGRAEQIKSFISDQPTDGNGHGTSCAGIIGGKIHGVAKRTKLYGVKAMRNEGWALGSDLVAGMDYIIHDSKNRGCRGGVITNMSFGGGRSDFLNNAANAMIRENIFVAVAAGNDHQDAWNISPASEPSVCTVGASDQNDKIWDMRPERDYGSNYGSIVDIFAPGSNILTPGLGGSVVRNSGTSLAAPHVAGLAAAVMSDINNYRRDLSKRDYVGPWICALLQHVANKDVLGNMPGGTNNLLLYTNGGY